MVGARQAGVPSWLGSEPPKPGSCMQRSGIRCDRDLNAPAKLAGRYRAAGQSSLCEIAQRRLATLGHLNVELMQI